MIDKDLEERMQMAQDVSSMVLALRRKVNIKCVSRFKPSWYRLWMPTAGKHRSSEER